MQPKGQIFSIDFIFSISIALLALGVVLQMNELSLHQSLEQQNREQLASIGRVASDRLVAHPFFSCELVSPVPVAAVPDALTHCIRNNREITREMLGIPDSYHCRLTTDLPPGVYDPDLINGVTGPAKCSDVVPVVTDPAQFNIFSIDRLMIVQPPGSFSTLDFFSCQTGGTCNFTDGNFTLTIWKDGV